MPKLTIRCLPLIALAASLCAAAQTAAPVSTDTFLGISSIPLRPGDAAPDAPTLTIFPPHPGTGNGTGVVIAPGGAYLGLASNLEGRQVADWFAARGITAFVLKYRLGAKNPYPLPLQDAQRAIRLVRSNAKSYGLSPQRIGMVGFSAGGHLAALTATTADAGTPGATDPIERASDRPDFLILGYPWLNAMERDEHGQVIYCSVLKIAPERCTGFDDQYTPTRHVSNRTPSTFIYMTADDELVPSSASVQFFGALLAAGVPAEMHMFRHGAHGSGLGKGDPALDTWPSLLEHWLRGQGYLTPDPSVGLPGTTTH